MASIDRENKTIFVSTDSLLIHILIQQRQYYLSGKTMTNQKFGVAQSWDDLVILDFGLFELPVNFDFLILTFDRSEIDIIPP
jgi:hypothetical protein